MQVTAALVKELRDETGLGMMECKNALVETQGDKAAAIKVLRERGLAIAGKKAERVAKDGRVACEIYDGGKTGVLIEVDCETDFVARNASFQAFMKDLVQIAKNVGDNQLAETVKDQVASKIAEIGENIIVRRNVKFAVQGEGIVAGYIHLGEKVGVLVEIGSTLAASIGADAFKEAVKDVALHIAASNPAYLQRADVPADVLAAEKEIYAKQVEGKPANIIEKIVSGKLEKFYQQNCLVEQAFVKDPDQTITEMLAARGKDVGDTFIIRRFVRYQVGA
ncbi:MAG: translation elongation factor Ts [Kiritimatiellae bacterium]|nr:translation elongation factor Ts [Kiritimatiellia bacterium]MCO5062249.1 translation elongation factor Ts [Kiritimatiellia bacterium]MCO5067213.1 translation elongation factor Ts [Kiritimatiellia bacterium]MCO6399610.1 translation elongation factor Ts [Verrucomicrobiota bacterium]